MNFQESMTILNAHTKKSGDLLNAPHMTLKAIWDIIKQCVTLKGFWDITELSMTLEAIWDIIK